MRAGIRPIVIIGAARSGTNILRSCIAGSPQVTTWPCDEINYIWRHGNRSHPHDELTADHATPLVRVYIRRAFEREARRGHAPCVLEKTCANSLRVGFVDSVLPDARFIFLVRDGRAVVASAIKRWRSAVDLGYILKKARFVPLTDVPYYALRFLLDRTRQRLTARRRLPSWGPRFEGIDNWVRDRTLPEVCAAQWAHSVAKAATALDGLGNDRVLRIRYETFVAEPEPMLHEIHRFIEIEADADEIRRVASAVSKKSLSRWRDELSGPTAHGALAVLSDQLTRFGYA